jgi:cytochrome c
MCKRLAGVLLVFFGMTMMALGDESPKLGVPVDQAGIAEIDFVVMPSGDGLPAGSGNAITGKGIYAVNCIACHGSRGEGGVSDVLVGGHGTMRSDKPVRTVGSFWPYATTLFDYIRRAMPYAEPGSLSADEVYALTAYLLFLNDIIAEEDIMTAETLPKVRMPNRDNFVWGYVPE